MNGNRQDMSREDRLAAKLRENLRRRKEQARGKATDESDMGGRETESSPPLPKEPRKS